VLKCNTGGRSSFFAEPMVSTFSSLS